MTFSSQPVSKSPRARRQANRETEFCLQGLQVITTMPLETHEAHLLASVFGSKRYEALPRYRRIYVEGYLDGARDALAAVHGAPVSKRPPAPVQMVPAAIQRLQPGADWHRHINGNGWVSSTAYVEASVYVGPNAVVFDEARVTGEVRLIGDACVYGQAELWGEAMVRGGAHICGTAQIGGRVRVQSLLVEQGRFENAEVLRNASDLRVGSPLYHFRESLQAAAGA